MSTRRRMMLGMGIAGALLVGYRAMRGGSETNPRESAVLASAQTSNVQNERESAPPRPFEPISPSHTSAPAEGAPLMASMRASFERAPLETLERARQAERESPDDPDAPERSWIIVRSLVNLGRFHEAREEAKVLVARSPETPWAIDVQRHLLVNPLDYPSREELQELAKAEAHP